MPAEILSHVRLGIETVRGTSVTATHIVDFETATLEHDVPSVRSSNLTGGVYQSPIVIPGVEMNRIKLVMGSIDWNFLQKWLAMAVDGTITSAGAGADKTWGTAGIIKPPALSTGAAVTEALKSATVEIGYANPAAATPAHKLTGCVVDRLKISWLPREFAKLEVDLISKEALTDLTAFSGVLTPTTVLASPDFSDFSCTIDDATIGTTADTAVIGGELEWTSFMSVDENRKRIAIGKQSDWSLRLTRFWEAADMIAAYRTKAKKKIRVKSTGPALGAGNYLLSADCYGYIDTRPLGDISGFKSEEIEVRPMYDATATTDISFGLVNAQAAL